MDKMYEIKRATDNINWNDIPVFEMGYAYLATPEDITAFGQICVGKEDIFVHLWANQSQIRAEEYGILGLPYKDSCLEFFFRPEETDPRYFNFEFNFNKCLYLGIGIDLKTRQRILLEDLEGIFKPITKRTKQGWEIFYRIPFFFIRRYFPAFDIYEGKILWANCYTCSDLADIPYYRSWSRVEEEMFTFHSTKCFGKMKITNDIAHVKIDMSNRKEVLL